MTLITILQGTVTECHSEADPAFARLYAKHDFISSEGVIVERGSHSKPNYFQQFSASRDGSNNVIIASGDAYATTNSNRPNATYELVIYDNEGNRLKTRTLKGLRIPHDVNPTSWADIAEYSDSEPADLPDTYYTADQVNFLLNQRLLANDPILTNAATTTTRGHVVFNYAPADANTPKVIGPNDPLLTSLAGNISTKKYRKSYASLAAAVTAAAGGELVFDQVEPITGATVLPRNILVSLEGDGIFDIASGIKLTIENLIDPGRQVKKGKGILVVKNAKEIPGYWYVGGFGPVGSLAETLDTSETSVDLVDASYFGNGPFAIAIDDEIMWVSAITGNTLTVERGFDGSTAAKHAGSTTASEALDATETGIDAADASVFGTVPFEAVIDSETVLVTNIASNTLTVTRGYNSTAATHLLGAAITQKNAVRKAFTQADRDGIKESLNLMGGGRLGLSPGEWGGVWGFNCENGMIVEGAGGIPDATNGTTVYLNKRQSYLFKIGDIQRSIYFRDVQFRVSGYAADNCTGVQVKSDGGLNGSFNVGFDRCSFWGGVFGADLTEATHNWLLIGLFFKMCYFIGQTTACFRSNTVNTSLTVLQCSFSPAWTDTTDAILLDYSGPATFINCTINGKPATDLRAHVIEITAINPTTGLVTAPSHQCADIEPIFIRVNQVARQAVVAPSNITTAGNAKCVVDIPGMPNSPKTVTFAVALSDTPSQIATKARTALNADADVSGAATAGGTGINIDLTRDTKSGMYDSMNFTIEDVTSVGITDDLVSVNVSGEFLPTGYTELQRLFFKPVDANTGYLYERPEQGFYSGSPDESTYRVKLSNVLAQTWMRTTVMKDDGSPRAAFHVKNTHCGISIINCQDEGLKYSLLVENTFEKNRVIQLINNTFAGLIQLNSQCKIESSGNFYIGGAFKDSRASNGSIVNSQGDNPYRIANYPVDITGTQMAEPCELNAFVGNSVFDFENREGLTRFNRPVESLLSHLYNGVDSAAITAGRPRYGSIDGPLAKFGTCESGATTLDTFYNTYLRRDATADNAAVGGFLSFEGVNLDGRSTLTEDLDSSETSVDVADGSIFNTGADETLTCESEQMLITSVSGNTLTVTRGYNSTTAAAHANGTAVYSTTVAAQTMGVKVSNFAQAGFSIDCKQKQVLEDSPGVFVLNALEADIFWFTPDQDSTVHWVNTFAGMRKTVYAIATGTNNYWIAWGNNCDSWYPNGFHTGYVAGRWTTRFESVNSTLDQVTPTALSIGSGAGPAPTKMATFYVTGTTQQMVSNVRYIVANDTLTTLTLPEAANIGDETWIVGVGANGWKVAQNANQQIRYTGGGVDGTDETTSGTGGYVQSTDRYAAMHLICVGDDVWALQGPITRLDLV